MPIIRDGKQAKQNERDPRHDTEAKSTDPPDKESVDEYKPLCTHAHRRRGYPLRQFPRNEPPPKFPVDAFPAPVCRLVKESAKAIGCPPDAIGLAALVAFGSAIGNSRVLQAKKNWTESATIFGAVVAEPGEKKRLLEDVCEFVAKEQGVWTGTPTELHQQFHSDHKPKRPDELSRFIKEAAEDEEGFIYQSEMDRFKDEESGEWKSQRVLTLYLVKWRNGVTREEVASWTRQAPG